MKRDGYFGVDELTREELIELKEAYMCELVNEGTYGETFGVEWNEPSWGEIAASDELVPDEVVFEHYSGVSFVDEDFFCNCAD